MSPGRSTRRTSVRVRAVAAAALLGLAAAPLTALPAAAADPVTLNLIDINDFHGRIDANTVAWAGTVEQLRAGGGDANTLFLSAGDNIGASLFASAVQDDQPTIDVLNALDLRASAVGNHEFDRGFADLTDRVVDGGDNARWAYLGANVYQKGTTTPALEEYEVVTVAGLRVGVIGAVTVETPTLVSPAGVADLDFGDPVQAVNRVAGQLTDGVDANGEADVLVASIHEGASDGTPDGATLEEEVAAGGAFADIVTGVSAEVAAIFTGHTHKQYAWDAPVPGQAGRTRPIIQTGNYGENLGHITLTVDPDDDSVTAYTVENVARTTADPATLVATYPRVAEVDEIVTKALDVAAVEGNRPIGTVTEDITTAYTDTDGDGVLDQRDDRGSESTLGNLVADVLRDRLAAEAVGGAEIGVVNPGGLRADLLYAGDTADNPANTDGVVTYAEANAVLPFVNNLFTTSLTGAQFVTLLEQQWQRDASGGLPSRSYLQLGLSDNVTYTFHEIDDPAVAGAQKGVIDSVTVDGEPLDLQRSYRIGTFSFLTSGGDNFRVFTEGADTRDSGLVDYEAWIAYLQANQPAEPDFARQAVRLVDQPTSVPAGTAVSFAVRDLDLTSLGSPDNKTVELTLTDAAGAVTRVGSFPVTYGDAKLAFTPARAGRYTVQVVAAPSGTTVRFPLTVTEAAPAPASFSYEVESRANRRTERAEIVVEVTNTATAPMNLRLTIPSGDTVRFAGVQPGATKRHVFRTGAGHLDAGQVRVAGYTYRAGQTSYLAEYADYDAVDATLDPRGRATGSAVVRRGQVVLVGTFTNRGGDAVTVAMRTDYGRSKSVRLKPGRTVRLRVASGEESVRRSTGVIVARKSVDGVGYRSTFTVRFPRK